MQASNSPTMKNVYDQYSVVSEMFADLFPIAGVHEMVLSNILFLSGFCAAKKQSAIQVPS